ncbi:unnamed protein product [Discula destructiva]
MPPSDVGYEQSNIQFGGGHSPVVLDAMAQYKYEDQSLHDSAASIYEEPSNTKGYERAYPRYQGHTDKFSEADPDPLRTVNPLQYIPDPFFEVEGDLVAREWVIPDLQLRQKAGFRRDLATKAPNANSHGTQEPSRPQPPRALACGKSGRRPAGREGNPKLQTYSEVDE